MAAYDPQGERHGGALALKSADDLGSTCASAPWVPVADESHDGHRLAGEHRLIADLPSARRLFGHWRNVPAPFPLAPEAGSPALLKGLVGVVVFIHEAFVEKIGARQYGEDTLVAAEPYNFLSRLCGSSSAEPFHDTGLIFLPGRSPLFRLEPGYGRCGCPRGGSASPFLATCQIVATSWHPTGSSSRPCSFY